jgi:hypothetical protein
MTAERRVAAIEGALTPTELVVAWLVEGQAYGGVDAFVRATLEEEDYVPPINRLAHAAIDSARLRAKGKRCEEIDKAANQAVARRSSGSTSSCGSTRPITTGSSDSCCSPHSSPPGWNSSCTPRSESEPRTHSSAGNTPTCATWSA